MRRDASIDPQLDRWMGLRYRDDGFLVLPPPLDGVEIGDVEPASRHRSQKTRGDRDRVRYPRERCHDRLVVRPVPGLGTHHGTALEVDHRHDLDRHGN
jgi:hypothetical protein